MDNNVNELIKGAQEGNESFALAANNLGLVERNAALGAFARMANENAAADAALPTVELVGSDGGNVTAVKVHSGTRVETAWTEGIVQQAARFVAEHHLSATSTKTADDAVGQKK